MISISSSLTQEIYGLSIVVVVTEKVLFGRGLFIIVLHSKNVN